MNKIIQLITSISVIMHNERIDYNKFHSQLALPFLETKSEFLEDIFRILENKFGLAKNSSQKFIDLGSGDGRTVFYVAKTYNIKSIGIDIDDNLINDSKRHLKSLKKNKELKRRLSSKIKFIEADFFTFNLKNYDFIYMYSLPSIHSYLKHLLKTVRPSTIIISHKYDLSALKSMLVEEWKLMHNDELFTFFYSVIDCN